MSQINTNAKELFNLAKALETLTNGHITVSEVFFLDELWFGHGDNYAWAAFFALPDQFQSLMNGQIDWAKQAPDQNATNTPVISPDQLPSSATSINTVGLPPATSSAL